MTYRLIQIAIVLFLGVLSTSSFAQESPEELAKQANELFEQEKYVEATSYFNRLVSADQRNHEWNFKYGTCLLYNAVNKGDAIKYLKYSVKGNVPDEALYYLGKAYHLNFEFANAAKYYNRYKKATGTKALKKLDVDRQITMCKNGQQLLSTMSDLVIQSKKSIKQEDFFRIYDLSNIGGTILVAKDYQSKLDKKKNHIPIVHFDKKAQFIIYSSYGDDGENLDLYMKRKLPNGTYSKPLKIQGSVNTPFDEGYAYMHPDGRKLYFSSKGHNSMGGFDVFEADYNPETNTFSNIRNLDFAISSPANDLFFVVDREFENCYFASDRQSKDGKIHVYKALVTRIPAQIAVIKGNYINKINPSNKKAEITVQDFATGKDVGKFNTQANGDYLLVLPKPGKYKYFVNADGSELTHVAVVEVPFLKEFRPLKQGMELVTMDGHEQLIINNMFDELFDDPSAILAEIYKKKAELVPNAEKFDIDSIQNAGQGQKILDQLGLGKLSPMEMGELANRTLEDAKLELANADKKENIAGNIANQKIDEAKKAFDEAEKLVNEAKNEDDPEKKKDLLDKAAEEFEKASILHKEAKSAISIIADSDKNKDSLKNVIEEGEKFNKTFKEAISKGDDTAINKVIEGNQDYLKTLAKNDQIDNSNDGNLDEGVIAAQDKYKEYTKEINDQEIKVNTIENDIAELNQTLKNTKKKKDKEAIQKQIEDKENEIDEIQEGILPNLEKKLAKAKKKYEEEVAKLTVKKEINDGVTNKENVGESNIDLSKADDEINGLGKKIDDLAVTIENDSKKAEDDIKGNQNVVQRSGDYANLKEEEVVEAVEPEYVKKIGRIKNSGKPKNEINQEIIEENEKLISTIDSKIDELNKKIEADPENENVQKWKDDALTLEEIKKEKVEENREIQEDIASNNENEGNTKISPVNSVVDIDPNFNSKKSNIENDANLDDKEKAEKLKELNSSTLAEVNKQIDITKENLDKEEDPEQKTILTNSLENLNSIKGELENKIDENENIIASKGGNDGNNGNNGNANNNVKPVNSVVDVDPNFNTKKSDIENDANLGDQERAKKLKELNTNTLNEVNNQILLTQDKLDDEEDPTQQTILSNSLENLLAIKTDLENQIQENENLITSNAGNDENDGNNGINGNNDGNNANNGNDRNSNGNNANDGNDVAANLTPIISIGDLDGNYEDQIENISNSELSEKQKAEEKNKINESVIDKINNELNNTNKALSDNPNNIDLLDRKNKLETIKSGIEQDIANNNSIIAKEEENNFNVADNKVKDILDDNADNPNNAVIALVNNSNANENNPENKIENTNPDKFKSDDSRNKYEDIKTDLKDLGQLKNENNKLKEELNGASPKDAKKIQKTISKNEKKIEKDENEVLEKIGPIKSTEINTGIEENNELVKNIAEVGVTNNTEILENSERKITQAVVLQNEAKELRAKADKTKSEGEKNKLLNDALKKENEAIILLENNKTALNIAKKEGEMTNQIVSAIVVANVPKDIKDRESKKQKDLANQYLNDAQNLQNEAQNLRDSSLTVKKKFRQALVNESDEKEKQANKKFQTGNKIMEEANKIEAKENEWLAAHEDSLKGRSLSPAVVNEVASKKEFKKFKKNIEASYEKTKEADKIAEEIQNLQKSSKRKIVEAIVNYEIADTTKGGNKAAAELKAKESIIKAEEDLKKIEDLQKKEADLRAEAKDLKSNAYSAIADLDTNTANNIITAANNDVKVVETVGLAEADFKSPTNLNGQNVFRMTNGNSPYNESNPVPKAGMVQGLVFKVQVGAFSKPIPQNTFQRFAPMSTETIRGNIKRYMVGYFATKNPANQARSQIRGLGYSDAFVVAYLNGKRISMTEADQLIASGNIPIDTTNNFVDNGNNNNANNNINNNGNNNENIDISNGNNNAANNNNNDNAANNNNQNNGNNAENNNNTNDNYNVRSGGVNSTQVEQMSGLFYTVQVGVYNRPPSPATLKNITPLNSQKIANGLIRYSSGVFNSVDQALQKRSEARSKGISDAFVTAYYNGKRITVAEAKKLLEDNGSGILYSGGNTDLKNNNQNNNENNENNNININNDNNTGNKNEVNNQNPTPEGVYFRVDVGTYGEDVPQEIAKYLFDKNYQIENETKIDGNINFFTNKIDKYDEAQKLKQKLVDEGLAKASVRAYYKYDEITIGSAMKILNGEKIEIKPINNQLEAPNNIDPLIDGNNGNNNNGNNENNNNEPDQLSPADYNKEAIYFKLIMGVFDGEVPQDKAKFFFDSDIKYEQDDLGRTTFYKGKYKNYIEVENEQKDLIQKGFEGSEIKAYYKFEEISVDLAKIILEYK